MNPLIAERIFDLRQGGSDAASITVGIDKPKWSAAKKSWSCNIYVERPDRSIVHTARGGDSLQALLIALRSLRSDVKELQAKYGPDITFLDQTDLWCSFDGDEAEDLPSLLSRLAAIEAARSQIEALVEE